MWFLFAAHVDNEMYLSRSLDRLGDSALNKDQEPDIAAAFLKFAVVTKELSALMKTLVSRMRLKCDGTRAETRFHLSAKWTSPFKSAGASVQSTAGGRAVHISLQGLYCSCKPVFCSHVTLTGYPLHSLVSPSLLLPCFTVCHHISTGLYVTFTVTDWKQMVTGSGRQRRNVNSVLNVAVGREFST